MLRGSILALLVLAAAAALGWLAWLTLDKAPAQPAPQPAAAAHGTGPPAAGTGRAPDLAPAALGGVLLQARYGDGAAAADVPVLLLESGGEPLFGARQARTDAAGCARFAGLPPGKYYAQAPCHGDAAPTACDVPAGAEASVTLSLPPGIALRGVVVDDAGRPVAGAAIALARWNDAVATVLTHSDADGRFAARDVGTPCGVGAFAAGLQPSPLQLLSAAAGAAVELRCELAHGGGALHGRVFDSDGRAVAGAVLRAGAPAGRALQLLPGGVRGLSPPPRQVRTDADGRFALGGLAAGVQPVQVRAPLLAPWRGEVQVPAGGDGELVLHLQPGVALRGSVALDDGAPVAGAAVQVGEPGELAFQATATAIDGSFAFAGLPAGELRLRADGGDSGRAETLLQAAAGQQLQWDAVLTRGLLLRGRVVDDRGAPAADVLVEAEAAASPADGAPWRGRARSGADGAFELPNCRAGVPLRLGARRRGDFAEVHLRDVLPGGPPLVLQLPPQAWVQLRGRVVGPDGAPAAEARLWPQRRDGGVRLAGVDPATGAFALGPYPAGEYRLAVDAPGCVRLQLPWRRLAADEVWDCGALRLERGGTLRVRLPGDRQAPPPGLRLAVLSADGTLQQPLSPQGLAGPFGAGDYVLQVRGVDVACRELPFAIEAGAETALDLALQPGVAVDFVFEVEAPVDLLHVDLRDAGGGPVLRTDVPRRPDGFGLTAGLAPGSYRLQARTDGGERGDAAVEVGGDGRARVAVRLQGR